MGKPRWAATVAGIGIIVLGGTIWLVLRPLSERHKISVSHATE